MHESAGATGGRGEGWSAESDFEAMPHDELHRLAQTGDPTAVIDAGRRLSTAGETIQGIADELNAHLAGLSWQSEAGDAFTGWARQIVQVTDVAADYSRTVGSFTSAAGEALAKVRSAVPPVPRADLETVAKYQAQQAPVRLPKGLQGPNDPVVSAGQATGLPGEVTAAEAAAAQTRIDAAHQEAIGAMESLGATYVGSAQALTVAEPPVFPPTPGALMPPVPGFGLSAEAAGAVVTGPLGPGRRAVVAEESPVGAVEGGPVAVPPSPDPEGAPDAVTEVAFAPAVGRRAGGEPAPEGVSGGIPEWPAPTTTGYGGRVVSDTSEDASEGEEEASV